MAVAAAINTNFTATTGNLEKNTKRAEGVVRGFGQRVNRTAAAALPGMGQLVNAAVTGLIANRVVQVFKRQFDSIGQLADQSLNLGIAPAQLENLRFGAEQAGVSADQLDTAIAKMADTFADAADGDVKEAKDAVEALGLSAANLVRLRPDQQLRQVADALSQVASTSRRIQLARDVFGRAGVSMLAFLANGAAGMDQAGRQLSQVGQRLTDFDVASIDQAGDAINLISKSFGLLAQQMTAGVAPAVTFFAESLAMLSGELSRTSATSEGWFERMYFRAVGELGVVAQRVMTNTPRGQELGFSARQFVQEQQGRIQRQSLEAAQRAQELRDAMANLGIGGAAATASRRRIEPASVEQGTAAFIEAVNKASGARGGDIPKKQLAVEEKQLKVLENMERAFDRAAAQGLGGFHPANLDG